MRRLSVILLALLLAACNLAVPQSTPTVVPTRTPSITPSAVLTATPSITPLPTSSPTRDLTEIALAFTDTPTTTSTLTPTPSNTPTATNTLTATPTETSTLTPQPTNTLTYTPTQTATPTSTATPTTTNTLPPTVTPLPLPTSTSTPTNTDAPTATQTQPPTLTSIPTLSDTQIAALLATRTPVPTIIPTFTAVPSGTPTNTLPAPTLDVTPTFITAAPDTAVPPATVSPVPGTSEPAGPTETPILPTLAVLEPTALPTQISVVGPPIDPNTRAFALTTAGNSGRVNTSAFALPVIGDVRLYSRNPVNPNRYAAVNSAGLLYLSDIALGTTERLQFSPFSQFAPDSLENNKTPVVEIIWSPNGQFLAFRVDGNQAEGNDGVWYWEFSGVNSPTDPTYHLLRDCPPGCQLVANPTNPDQWESLSMEWSPGSDALLIQVNIPTEGRRGVTIVGRANDSSQASNRPPIYRYDYGTWSADGSRVLLSGRSPDGRSVLGWLYRDGSENVFFDASASGLWLQDAVERPGGQIVALGSTGGANTVMRLYAYNGFSMDALSGNIGEAPPVRVEWSPDRSAVLVVTADGRYYVARADLGTVTEISADVAGALAVEWVQGDLPQTSAAPVAPVGEQPAPPPSTGGGAFSVGQQVTVLVESLNVRTQPSLSAGIAGGAVQSELLTIVSGPASSEGLTWWQVQTPNGAVGWIVYEIDGLVTVGG
jgi:hypothetical protein